MLKEVHPIDEIHDRHINPWNSWERMIELRDPPQMQAKLTQGNIKIADLDFLGGSVVKNLPANAGEMGLIPGLGRSHMLRSN